MIRKESYMDDSLLNMENSEMIIKFLSHEATEEEKQLVVHWIQESDENKNYFESIKRIYENRLEVEEIAEFNADDIWATFQSRYLPSQSFSEPASISPVKRMIRYAVGIAAIGLVLLGIAYVYNSTNHKTTEIVSKEVIVDYKLPDGSVISLNKNSSLHYSDSFDKKQRELNLVGEAFFDVKKDKSKPFIIHINSLDIEVVGTAFEVNGYPANEKTEVVVQRGIVKVTSHDGNEKSTIVLRQGDKAEILKKTNNLLAMKNHDPNYVSWKTQVYVFEMTKMSEVFKTLEKDYDVSITLTDEEFNNCSLFARFDKNSLDDILTIIKHTFSIDYSINGKNIVIKGKGC